jgi:hypothetical protein
VQALDERLPHDTSSIRRAAWAGLQDREQASRFSHKFALHSPGS